MVRFIIDNSYFPTNRSVCIYIPIWLDLLCVEKLMNGRQVDNLHSNMVRFIISSQQLQEELKNAFTFQYG